MHVGQPFIDSLRRVIGPLQQVQRIQCVVCTVIASIHMMGNEWGTLLASVSLYGYCIGPGIVHFLNDTQPYTHDRKQTKKNLFTHAYSVWWTSHTAALVWWRSHNDGVMEVTSCSIEVAASAGVVAG